ncbi:alpha/beta hydrolase [Levilactobacillus zymae]|nr:alpha/beta hydrolase [Levilactobacillus zymae]
MMRWVKRYRGLGVILAVILLLSVPGLFWRSEQTRAARANYRSAMAPVILVPGSSATQNRFNQLVKELNTQTKTQHSLLRVEVKTNNQLVYSGAIRRGDRQPFIVIGFQNRADGLTNIRKQAAWFAVAFQALQKTYHFNHFSAMGHSNGGLVLTLFMENAMAKTGAHADRLMTIASPFNLEEADPKVDTPMFTQLVAGRQHLSKDLVVYSLAGSQSYTGDGIVPFDSVDRGKYIFQKQVKSFTQITVSGANANHANLPENQQIVRLIRQDLLD